MVNPPETDENTSPTQLSNAAEVLPCLCMSERNEIFRFFPQSWFGEWRRWARLHQLNYRVQAQDDAPAGVERHYGGTLPFVGSNVTVFQA